MKDPKDNVIQLRRPPHPSEMPGTARCSCGSYWFKMLPHQSSTPVVSMTPYGRISAWNARFVCKECDKPFRVLEA